MILYNYVCGLFAWIVLSVWISKSHKMIALLFPVTFGGFCFHQFLLCGRQKFLHKHQWMYWPNLACQVRYSVGASMGQPDTRWSMVSMCLSYILYFESAPFFNMFTWKFLIGRLWSCTAMLKPLVTDFRPDEASYWWVSGEFTSGSLARIGYLSWRGLSFHPSFSSLIFLIFFLCLNLFCFSSRCRIFRNVVIAKVNLI